MRKVVEEVTDPQMSLFQIRDGWVNVAGGCVVSISQQTHVQTDCYERYQLIVQTHWILS